MSEPELSHFNADGEAHMVDVGSKSMTHRVAVAEGRVAMRPETLALIASGGHKKGDVLGVARVAGIMAAKRTAELVPLCHPLPLTRIDIDLQPEPDSANPAAPPLQAAPPPTKTSPPSQAPPAHLHCRACVETVARTGVEMEALNAVQVTLLTVYDMCKSVDRGMTITDVRLVEKSGGKSGHWRRSTTG